MSDAPIEEIDEIGPCIGKESAGVEREAAARFLLERGASYLRSDPTSEAGPALRLAASLIRLGYHIGPPAEPPPCVPDIAVTGPAGGREYGAIAPRSSDPDNASEAEWVFAL